MIRHSKAFTLVELMVVLLVTLIITGVALQVFTTVNSVNEQAMESTRIQTRHSVGIAQLSRLIRQDGYGAWAYEGLTGNAFEHLLLSPSGVDGSSELTIYAIDQASIEDMVGAPDPNNPGDNLMPEIVNMVPRPYAFYLKRLGESHTLYVEDPEGNRDPLIDGVRSFKVEVRSDVNGDGTFYLDNGEIQPQEDWVDIAGFGVGALIIPMDSNNQTDEGVIKAYGLIYEVLKKEIRVYWCIKGTKETVASPDFVRSSFGVDPNFNFTLGSTSNEYAGGPFIIEAFDLAGEPNIPKIQSILDNSGGMYEQVVIHKVISGIAEAPIYKIMMKLPPKIAVVNNVNNNHSGQGALVLSSYLKTAGICGDDVYSLLSLQDIADGKAFKNYGTDTESLEYDVIWMPHVAPSQRTFYNDNDPGYHVGVYNNSLGAYQTVIDLDDLAPMTSTVKTQMITDVNNQVEKYVEMGGGLFLECASIRMIERYAPVDYLMTQDGGGLSTNNLSGGEFTFNNASIGFNQVGDYDFIERQGTVSRFWLRDTSRGYRNPNPANLDPHPTIFAYKGTGSNPYVGLGGCRYLKNGKEHGFVVYMGGHAYVLCNVMRFGFRTYSGARDIDITFRYNLLDANGNPEGKPRVFTIKNYDVDLYEVNNWSNLAGRVISNGELIFDGNRAFRGDVTFDNVVLANKIDRDIQITSITLDADTGYTKWLYLYDFQEELGTSPSSYRSNWYENSSLSNPVTINMSNLNNPRVPGSGTYPLTRSSDFNRNPIIAANTYSCGGSPCEPIGGLGGTRAVLNTIFDLGPTWKDHTFIRTDPIIWGPFLHVTGFNWPSYSGKFWVWNTNMVPEGSEIELMDHNNEINPLTPPLFEVGERMKYHYGEDPTKREVYAIDDAGQINRLVPVNWDAYDVLLGIDQSLDLEEKKIQTTASIIRILQGPLISTIDADGNEVKDYQIMGGIHLSVPAVFWRTIDNETKMIGQAYFGSTDGVIEKISLGEMPAVWDIDEFGKKKINLDASSAGFSATNAGKEFWGFIPPDVLANWQARESSLQSTVSWRDKDYPSMDSGPTAILEAPIRHGDGFIGMDLLTVAKRYGGTGFSVINMRWHDDMGDGKLYEDLYPEAGDPRKELIYYNVDDEALGNINRVSMKEIAITLTVGGEEVTETHLIATSVGATTVGGLPGFTVRAFDFSTKQALWSYSSAYSDLSIKNFKVNDPPPPSVMYYSQERGQELTLVSSYSGEILVFNTKTGGLIHTISVPGGAPVGASVAIGMMEWVDVDGNSKFKTEALFYGTGGVDINPTVVVTDLPSNLVEAIKLVDFTRIGSPINLNRERVYRGIGLVEGGLFFSTTSSNVFNNKPWLDLIGAGIAGTRNYFIRWADLDPSVPDFLDDLFSVMDQTSLSATSETSPTFTTDGRKVTTSYVGRVVISNQSGVTPTGKDMEQTVDQESVGVSSRGGAFKVRAWKESSK